MEDNEDYFSGLTCVRCKKNYWTDERTKLCRFCIVKHQHNDNKQSLDDLMREKDRPSVKFVLPGQKK